MGIGIVFWYILATKPKPDLRFEREQKCLQSGVDGISARRFYVCVCDVLDEGGGNSGKPMPFAESRMLILSTDHTTVITMEGRAIS